SSVNRCGHLPGIWHKLLASRKEKPFGQGNARDKALNVTMHQGPRDFGRGQLAHRFRKGRRKGRIASGVLLPGGGESSQERSARQPIWRVERSAEGVSSSSADAGAS